MNNAERVLITGSSGFIGRHLAAECEAYWPGVSITRIDIQDGQDCRWFFATDDGPRYDVAFHCAAITGGIEGTTNNAAFQSATNAQLDGAFFEWLLRAKPRRSVYFSSSCAYPCLTDTAMMHKWLLREQDLNLDTAYADGTPYGAVKLTGEIIARSVRKAGIPISVVRPFAVYGTDQEDCRMIPAFIDRVKSGNESSFEVWGPGWQASDFIHVDDAVNALIAMIENDIDGPVNLGTGRGATVDEVAKMILSKADRSLDIVHRMDKPYGPQWRVADPTLLETFYKPTVTLEEGIDRALIGRVSMSYGRGDDLA